MQEEIWKDIDGFSSYQISNQGRLKSKAKRYKSKRSVNGLIQEFWVDRKELIRNPTYDSWGYLQAGLKSDDGSNRNIKIHILVAKCFIGEKPTNKHQVNHKDENKTNNKVDNLQWVTQSQNMRHNNLHIRKGLKNRNNHLSKKVVKYDLDMNFICEYPSISEASRQTKDKVNNIVRVCKCTRKTSKGFIWRYKENKDV
jgi:hypothetical protein